MTIIIILTNIFKIKTTTNNKQATCLLEQHRQYTPESHSLSGHYSVALAFDRQQSRLH